MLVSLPTVPNNHLWIGRNKSLNHKYFMLWRNSWDLTVSMCCQFVHLMFLQLEHIPPLKTSAPPPRCYQIIIQLPYFFHFHHWLRSTHLHCALIQAKNAYLCWFPRVCKILKIQVSDATGTHVWSLTCLVPENGVL